MKKIGIMGGTFNPVHLAHLLLAESAREQAGLSAVMFLPSKRTAEKSESYILPDELRCKLLELAIAGNPDFYLSTLEIERGGVTYTADTVTALKKEHPETEFYFIIGGDSLVSFPTWRSPEVILKHAHLLATSRGGLLQEQIQAAAGRIRREFGADVEFFDTPQMEISSTNIRKRLAAHRSVKYLVPEAVERFLREQGCYQGTEKEALYGSED